ncbi:MAG: TolB protein [Thermoanaerobaculia bacterium]|jgi:TolB protein|nr:TolB protein [Thermoanaerobaculia bacterium]
MRPTTFLLSLILLLAALPLAAQTQIRPEIDARHALQVARIAVPRPETTLPLETINAPFFAPLTRDLAYSGVFAIAPIPPGIPPGSDLAKAANAQFVLALKIDQQGEEYIVDARLLDSTGAQQSGQRYRGGVGALTRIAHTLANDLVRVVNGKPGIFLSLIAFASNRSGNFEIWLMDWDGSNQRQITHHNALSILPSWSADSQRLVYTSFFGGTSDMYVISRRGGARSRVPTGLNLNTSATFSPVANDIAFVGSVAGNPDVYVVKDDGSNRRRLTHDSSIESTPEWSPNGRQISFTSGRSGSPQIYTMDAEGSSVQRISFEGEWNDDATWSPDGSQLAYTSRVNGRFQIRIADLATHQSRILAGEASNEQPAWSPDGRWVSFQSNRSGRWQIYRMRVDGTDLLQLTFDGENKDPDWSKKGE